MGEREGGTSILRKEIREQVGALGSADIVVGIPSYNNAGTIAHVVRAVHLGLQKYFPERKAVLVNSDGGSTDGTMDVVRASGLEDLPSVMLSHRVGPFHKITTPYQGLPGKGSAFRTVFEIATALEARACAVVDSDLRSITPEWIELLLKPVLERDFDYVAPLYHRHKFDGTITNGIVYPMTRALYGQRIRQPIGGDFGFSGRLARFYLTRDVWDTDVARFGIDIWMTTTAVANGFRVCQSFLGAKIHDAKDPGADLSAMLRQVVSATFDLTEEYQGKWRGVQGSVEVPTFGFVYAVGLEPVAVNVERMLERFRLGVRELGDILEEVLPARTYEGLTALARAGSGDFHMSEETWVEVIYSFALASRRRVIHKDHLLGSLTPLYIGRTASFVIENRESDAAEVEEKIEGLCRAYEAAKADFIKEWDRT